jgi:hypothetical protein
MVKCINCQKITRREADGTSFERLKCTHGAACTFRQIVSEEICQNCILQQEWSCHCSFNKPSNVIFLQPVYNQDKSIVYTNGLPPKPYGYEETDNPHIFKTTWPACAYLEYANELNNDGSVKIKVRCAITKKLMDPQTCSKCLGDIDSISPKEYPALATELKNYAIAIKNWVAAGRPERTDHEVRELHTKYCTKCDWYDPTQERCKGCGCKTRAEGSALVNKIKMGNQHCPKLLW